MKISELTAEPLFVVARLDIDYTDEDGGNGKGTVKLVVPVKDAKEASAVTKALKETDFGTDHEDLLQHIAQNSFDDFGYGYVSAYVENTTKAKIEPKGRNDFTVDASDFLK